MIVGYTSKMYHTLIDNVKAWIDQKVVEGEGMTLRGWAFSEDNGVCPIRCRYESTIRSVDIEIRKDIVDRFARPNVILSGWKIHVPLHKYIDFQIKLGSEWCTFLSYHSAPQTMEPILEADAEVKTPVEPPPIQNIVVNPPVFVPNPSNVHIISFDSRSSPSNVFIVDHFYDRPDDVRLFGVSSLQQSNSADVDSIKSNLSLQQNIQKIIGKPIASFSQYEENGRFSLSHRTTPVSLDTKPYQYAGIVFLTPNAPVTAGITMYKSKINSTEVEAVDIVGNVYNRIVLFNAKMIHSVTHHFGSEMEDGRLIQQFAFDLL